jgi:hypothetical protein
MFRRKMAEGETKEKYNSIGAMTQLITWMLSGQNG